MRCFKKIRLEKLVFILSIITSHQIGGKTLSRRKVTAERPSTRPVTVATIKKKGLAAPRNSFLTAGHPAKVPNFSETIYL